jgi:hypothetical protein
VADADPRTALILRPVDRRTARREPWVLATGVTLLVAGAGTIIVTIAPVLPVLATGFALTAIGVDARRSWMPRYAGVLGAFLALPFVVWGKIAGVPDLLLAPVIAGGAAAATSHALGFRARRRLAALDRAHAAGAPLEPHVDALIELPRLEVFEGAARLARWQRFDLVERLAMTAIVPACDGIRHYYLAMARWARGDLDGADGVLRAADRTAHGPIYEELWLQLGALIRIARGEAAEVIAELQQPCPLPVPALLAGRRIALADAYVATGDPTGARAVLLDVLATHGRDALVGLRRSPRRSAPIAAALLDGETPYR